MFRHDQDNIHRYADQYSEEGFWATLKRSSRKAGRKALRPALRMYYAARDPNTPRWARTTLYSALGYFVSPIDAIPDMAPILGYTDDIGVMAAAAAVVALHITQEHTAKADARLERFLKESEN